MHIVVYPLVWFISDKGQSFLGMTFEGERKCFSIPQRKSCYDRHQWGMFHWFEGNFCEDSQEFIIERIVEKEPPQIKTGKVWSLLDKDGRFHAEIKEETGTTHFEASSISALDQMLLNYIEKYKLDRLYTNQPFVMINSQLISYMIYTQKEMVTTEQIRTYCNALSCTPRELNDYKAVYPTLWKLEIPLSTKEEQNISNFQRKLPLPGEYRNLISYDISNLYIEEILKSNHHKIQYIGRIMSQLDITHRYYLMRSIQLPSEVIKNIDNKIQQHNPVSISGFKIEVVKQIDDSTLKEIGSYDYVIQVSKSRRLIYHNEKFKKKGFCKPFPYLLKLLESITKNWYQGKKKLPSIPKKFFPEDVVVPQTVIERYYITPNLREVCEEYNIPTDVKVPCIRIRYDFQSSQYWPLNIYDPNQHQIAHDVYQKSIEKIYNELKSL